VENWLQACARMGALLTNTPLVWGGLLQLYLFLYNASLVVGW
jgi:hypothetical protein